MSNSQLNLPGNSGGANRPSPLSLLLNAADGRSYLGQQQQQPAQGSFMNQQQLLQQLSQHMSQQQQQIAPPMQMPPQQQQQQQQQNQPQLSSELLNLVRSGNLAGLASLMAGGGGGNPPAADSNGAPTASGSIPTSINAPPSSNDELRQRLMAQFASSQFGTTNAASAPAPVAGSEPPTVVSTCTNSSSLLAGGPDVVRASFRGDGNNPAALMSANSDAVKDERRKAPGSVIVPCRARGMPMDHNFKTAYFVIPENVRHGEELICSYFACRNAGIKFRYCSSCKVPVAKRNFRKRHKHGDTSGGVGGDDESVEEEGSLEGEPLERYPHAVPSAINNSNMNLLAGTAASGGIPSQVTTKIEERKEKASIPSQVTTTTKMEDRSDNKKSKKKNKEGSSSSSNKGSSKLPPQEPDKEPSSKRDKKSSSSSNNNKRDRRSRSSSNNRGDPSAMDSRSICMRDGAPRSSVAESRSNRWGELLESRPSTRDGDAMATWLMEVLAVSDLWKPLKESGKMPNLSLALIQQCTKANAAAAAAAQQPASAAQEDRKSRKERKRKERRQQGHTSTTGTRTDNSGSSDSQDTNQAENSSNSIESDNQEGINAENSSNDSDNQERQATIVTKDDKPSSQANNSIQPNGSGLLKKRPVSIFVGEEREAKKFKL